MTNKNKPTTNKTDFHPWQPDGMSCFCFSVVEIAAIMGIFTDVPIYRLFASAGLALYCLGRYLAGKHDGP